MILYLLSNLRMGGGGNPPPAPFVTPDVDRATWTRTTSTPDPLLATWTRTTSTPDPLLATWKTLGA